MLGKLLHKTKPDPELNQRIETERFHLIPCNQRQAIKITLGWANDPEILRNLMHSKDHYSPLEWVGQVGKPDNYNLFYHAILAKENGLTIGANRVRIDEHGTANNSFVLHSKKWRGKGVLKEVRPLAMDFFAKSDRVHRFYARILAHNVAAIKSCERIGFRKIGVDTGAAINPTTGEYQDTVHFEFLKSDWIAMRKKKSRD